MTGIATAIAAADAVVLPISGALSAWCWANGLRGIAWANAAAATLLAVSLVARVVTA